MNPNQNPKHSPRGTWAILVAVTALAIVLAVFIGSPDERVENQVGMSEAKNAKYFSDDAKAAAEEEESPPADSLIMDKLVADLEISEAEKKAIAEKLRKEAAQLAKDAKQGKLLGKSIDLKQSE